MKRRIFIVLLAIVAVLAFTFGLAACGSYTKGLAYTEIEQDGEIIAYSVSGIGEATDSDIVIPSKYEGKPVTGIGDKAFKDNKNLTSVTIGKGVTSIGDDAFGECSALKSITIPDSVTSVGEDAFLNTAYYKAKNNWEDEVLYIGKHLIKANSSISESYEIKTGTLIIADMAFSGCIGLRGITIPDSVTHIGYRSFSGCRLSSVTIPNSVISIGDGAFEANNILSSVTIPNSVTSIGHMAFASCGLTSVTIPDSVTNFGVRIFENCSFLSSITLPANITGIGWRTFYNCSSLTSVTIPDSVSSIDDEVFYNCSKLTSVTIGKGVTSIGDSVFYRCSRLRDIYFNGTKEQWENVKKSSIWDDTTPNYTIHCTDGELGK